MSSSKTLVWFRQDLRLSDNPALVAAAHLGQILPVYILDDVNPGDWRLGAASRWWLHHSLAALDASLSGNLQLYAGDPATILPRLAEEQGASHIMWNRCYEPWRVQRDKGLKSALEDQGLQVETHNGSLLWEPWTNLKDDDTPYRVFTPYYRRGRERFWPPQSPARKPANLSLASGPQGTAKLAALQLMPDIDWYGGLEEAWTPGEAGANNKLRYFLREGLADYRTGRDRPASRSVSRLSPHLHHGEISPRQLWHAVQRTGKDEGWDDAAEHFQRELAWREFSYSLLYHFPTLRERNLNEKFNDFPWTREQTHLEAWQRGQTGYPLIDAGMRELWQTGYMHNRVRMVVASFLVKNLMHHWLDGARWFWDCLVDADLANNSCSWQWVAGSGADASPYFRIFNPVSQSQQHDPRGDYIRRFVPELKDLPDRYLHDPGSAPDSVLRAAGVQLGRDYPTPIVGLKETRERALNAYKDIK